MSLPAVKVWFPGCGPSGYWERIEVGPDDALSNGWRSATLRFLRDHLMHTIGVLLVSERRGILSEIVRDIVACDPVLALSGEVTGTTNLAAIVDRTGAQAVVWLVDRLQSAAATELLRRRPAVRLVTVESDGREGFLWEMRPHRRELGALSPDLLVSALRGSGGAAAS